MAILSKLQCGRCGQQMKKDTTEKYCKTCIDRYSPEDWQRWEDTKSHIPSCLYCGKPILGRARTTIMKGRVKFCSATCKALSESKIKEDDFREIVRLYSQAEMTARDIAKRYNCTSTIILNVLHRFTDVRLGAQPGEKNIMFGNTHTPEARAKIRAANLRQFSDQSARDRHAELTTKQIQEGRTGKSFNKLEKVFASILDEMGIAYQWQSKMGRFVFDFLIDGTSLFIETHGTFWHADPRFYNKDALKPAQERNIANDIKKATLARDMGFSLLCVWEHDIHQNRDMIKSLVLAALHEDSKAKNKSLPD